MSAPLTQNMVNSEKRKLYLFQVVLQLAMGLSYLFACTNFLANSPLTIVGYNFAFGVFFTGCYWFRKNNLDRTILIAGIGFQLFIFGHAYYLLPGKQIEAGLGILTSMLPIFLSGLGLWYFFTSNLILYHIVLYSVDYEQFFFGQYIFYIVIFILIRAVVKENVKYERELIVQRDKIRRDAKKLKAADELKNRFFANISHELRTPLTLLVAPIQNLLGSTNLSEKQQT